MQCEPRAYSHATVCRILRKPWRGKLPLNTIVRPSCPRAIPPLPARAKRCASFLVLSTSVRRGNFQPELISSCWTTLPAFAAARGRTSKFRGALATEEARGRAAIVPRKSANPPEGESAPLRREGNRARNPEENRPSRQQSRSAPFQLRPDRVILPHFILSSALASS